jgi:hypothetical protein
MRRHFDPIRLTARASAVLIAALLTLALAAGASAAEPLPTLGKPADQVSTVGVPITTVVVKGTNLATLTSKELPAGLKLNKVSETEWTITGTPTTPKAAVTVTLEATNTEKDPTQTTTFSWTISEALPTLVKPASQTGPAGTPITTLLVKGTNLATLTSKELPAGLKLNKVSEAEWTITGTPTTPKAVVTVTLEATNTEKDPTQTTTFKWTIAEALATVEKPADQPGTTGVPITTLAVKGTNLATLTAKELPAGLVLTQVSETEWTITGTPTTPKAATAVTLEASNKEKAPIQTTTFQWTIAEGPSTIEKPADQTSAAGLAIATVIIRGTTLDILIAKELPAGLTLTEVSETEWTITGTPTTPKAAFTVTLEATNTAKDPTQTTTFTWTVGEVTVPSVPLVSSTLTPTPATPAPSPTPIAKITSAGQLGTVPVQKPGKSLSASFRCEVAACRVVLTATVTAGKSKFKIRSSPTSIKLGQKPKIVMKLSKKQQALIAATLKKHKKVSASVAATIESTVGLQTTKSLAITVRR